MTLFREHTIVIEEGQNSVHVRNVNIQGKMLSYGLAPSCRRTLGDTGASQDYAVIYLKATARQKKNCCGFE